MRRASRIETTFLDDDEECVPSESDRLCDEGALPIDEASDDEGWCASTREPLDDTSDDEARGGRCLRAPEEVVVVSAAPEPADIVRERDDADVEASVAEDADEREVRALDEIVFELIEFFGR